MPCIMFSEHERQQAAHYLHSTQISGLVSAGISFQVGMNLSIELRLGTPHALVDSSDTQKSLCSCVSSLYTLLLFIWICEICITSQIRGQHANYRKNATCHAFFAEMSKCALRRWSALTSVKVNKSKSFSILNCVPPMSSSSLPGGEMCDAVSQIWLQGKKLRLKFVFSFFLPSLSITLSPSLPLFLPQMKRQVHYCFSRIPKSPEAVTPPPRGCLGVLSGRGEEAHLPEMRTPIRQLCCRLLFKLFAFTSTS